jgi:hypothetical protein
MIRSVCQSRTRRQIRFEELSPDEFRIETEGSWPRPVVDMLLAAWAATMGRRAFITSGVFDIPRIASAIVSRVGRGSRHGVYGRSNPIDLTFAMVRYRRSTGPSIVVPG